MQRGGKGSCRASEAIPIRLKAKPRMELARKRIEQEKPEEAEKQPAPKISRPEVIGEDVNGIQLPRFCSSCESASGENTAASPLNPSQSKSNGCVMKHEMQTNRVSHSGVHLDDWQISPPPQFAALRTRRHTEILFSQLPIRTPAARLADFLLELPCVRA
jgi:hypothetical protein